MRDASLIDHPHANERAKAAIALLDSPDFTTSTTTHAALLAATTLSAVPPAAEPLASVAAPDSEEGIDAELLEIFLTEAVEVLEAVSTTLPAARSEPHQQEHLTTLRRSFHTLKGSGRMVGLMSFGEAAWSIEQVMNQRLSESRGGDADLYALLEMAHDTLGRWVDDLQRSGRSSATGDRLIAAAGRLIAGLPVGAADMEALPESHESDAAHGGTTPLHETAALQETIPQHETVAPHDAAPLQEPGEPEELQLSDDEMRLFGEPAAMTPESVAPGATAPVAEELPILLDADELALPAALQDAETPAAETPLPSLLDPFDFMPFDAGTEQSGTQLGTAAVIEFPTLLAPDPQRNDNVKQIGALEIGVPLYNIYLAETDELVRLLSHDFDEWRHEPERRVNVAAVHAAHSLAGTSATVGFKPLQEIAHGLEAVLQQLARMPVRLLVTERDMLDQVLERIRFMLQLFALGEMAEHEPQQVALLHALQQEVTSRAEAAEAHEQAASLPEPPSAAAMPADPDALAGFAEAPAAAVAAAQNNAPVIAPAMAAAFARSGQGSAPEILPQSTVQVKDELDPDLMPVFTEEANDMLPQMGQILRAWQLAPGDPSAPQSLLRLLHTIKGSARMAGAMRLGQHMHEMESRIEQVMHLTTQSPHVFEDLLARHDHGLQMFDSLLNPQAAAAATTAAPADAVIAATYDGAGETELHSAADTAAVMPPAPEQGGNAPMVVATGMPDRRETQRLAPDVVPVATAPVPLVRVRADILDRLVNQAGEVSISRSRLENEVDAMRQSMIELTENVARLREQLREVEMQAESQIANQTSQRSNAPDGQFDPLEFDRFTRLQELTRMMAESVNDVGSVQQNLARTLDSASGDLSIQARLTRELQQDLMSVRMVQFASISERLYRVTRQASKEVDKRVNLDIRGSAVEIDRSVLEKMAGPFEHLLRNAIVHGIEMRAARQSAGKNEVGELLIEVRQEGNEVVIQFSDDGQGLNLERIRNKAMQTGLLTDDSVITDGELTDLIFHPGFSTAAEVTELAGRGVGMDVVRSEATALGGRVEIISTPGKGAQFTVHLPLTLAVTQVLLLTTGGKTYAVPSVLIEQVQQLKTQALAAAYNEGAVTWQSQRVPMAYLAALLGDAGVSAVAQQYSPLIILKSGNNRIAIHVDEILGNREVVVKNIGPQLSRLTGIAGATVLGSGEIVLILNPVALAQRGTEEGMRAPRSGEAGEAASMGAVAEFGSNRTVQPVAGLRTQNIVMVVDDSLTVRRVTQRLLSREGYQVVLAKDGVDALEQLQSITPDVMLVDIEMPRMDGFDLTRNIRDDERTRHIPIIMITSRTASKHRNFAFELGVNEYLGKPYQEDMLLASVAGFLKKDSAIS
ncbi:MAG: Hpt domain-containing protein [Herminiimonas sp.]|nr:Hpt domain-containing protein [Herminiimonas sp.]